MESLVVTVDRYQGIKTEGTKKARKTRREVTVGGAGERQEIPIKREILSFDISDKKFKANFCCVITRKAA